MISKLWLITLTNRKQYPVFARIIKCCKTPGRRKAGKLVFCYRSLILWHLSNSNTGVESHTLHFVYFLYFISYIPIKYRSVLEARERRIPQTFLVDFSDTKNITKSKTIWEPIVMIAIQALMWYKHYCWQMIDYCTLSLNLLTKSYT